MLILLLACVGTDKPAGPDDTALPDDTAPPDDTAGLDDTAGPDDPTPDCDAVDCFTVCGLPVARAAPVVTEGFSDVRLPEHMTFDVAWHEEEAISVDFHALVRRDAALVERDRVDLLPGPYEVAVAGDTAFASGRSGVSVVGLGEGALSPLAWWAPPAAEDVMFVGADGERVVLATLSGLSLVDVSDPLAPTELGCATWTDREVWGFDIGNGYAAVARTEGVAVYALDVAGPALLGVLPAGEEPSVALDGDRLLVWEDFRTVVLYALTPDTAPVELARIEDDMAVQVTAYGPPVAGGLALAGGLDDDDVWAIDLTDDALPLYRGTDPDPRYACLVRYTGPDGAEIDVAPLWRRDARWPAGTADLTCPGGASFANAPSFGAREPGGNRLLLEHGGWTVYDLDTGEETALTPLAGQFGAWLDDGFAIGATEGADWNIPLVSTVTRLDATGAVRDTIESPSPFVASTGFDRALWVVSEPTGRDYGDPEPPAADHVLWLLRATGDRVDVTLPAGAAPVDVIAGGDRAWVFDEAGAVHIYDADLAVTTCPLPDGLGAGARVASALGAFFVDSAGLPSVVTDTCVVTRLDTAPLGPDTTFAGADERWVYLAADVAPATGFLTAPRVQARDPSTFAVVGRLPTSRTGGVFGGERVVVLDNTILSAGRP
jgi:hypothetical protein